MDFQPAGTAGGETGAVGVCAGLVSGAGAVSTSTIRFFSISDLPFCVDIMPNVSDVRIKRTAHTSVARVINALVCVPKML